MLVAGETGAGKSRLLEELEGEAAARQLTVVRGRLVDEDRTFPLEMFCDAIHEFFASAASGAARAGVDLTDVASDLARAFPTLGEISAIRAAATTACP